MSSQTLVEIVDKAEGKSSSGWHLADQLSEEERDNLDESLLRSPSKISAGSFRLRQPTRTERETLRSEAPEQNQEFVDTLDSFLRAPSPEEYARCEEETRYDAWGQKVSNHQALRKGRIATYKHMKQSARGFAQLIELQPNTVETVGDIESIGDLPTYLTKIVDDTIYAFEAILDYHPNERTRARQVKQPPHEEEDLVVDLMTRYDQRFRQARLRFKKFHGQRESFRRPHLTGAAYHHSSIYHPGGKNGPRYPEEVDHRKEALDAVKAFDATYGLNLHDERVSESVKNALEERGAWVDSQLTETWQKRRLETGGLLDYRGLPYVREVHDDASKELEMSS